MKRYIHSLIRNSPLTDIENFLEDEGPCNTRLFNNTTHRINNQQANIYTLYCGIPHCFNLLPHDYP